MRLLITDVQSEIVHVVRHNKRWRMSMKTWNHTYIVTLKPEIAVGPVRDRSPVPNMGLVP